MMFESQRLYIKNLISVLIQECKNMSEMKQIQTQIITSPYMLKSDQNFLINRLLFVCALSDMGSLRYAKTIFQQIENPKLSDYNIMIRASACKFDEHLESGIYRSLVLYKRMLVEEIRPDFLTFPFLVKECANRFDGVVGRSIHAHILKLGFESDLFIQNFLIDFYFVSRALDSAGKVFDEMLNRDLVSWNSMVVGYLRNGDLDAALDLFRRMEKRNVITWNSIITGFVQGGRSKEALELFHEMQLMSDGAVKPDKITIASILSACASLGAIDHGKWIHDYLKRSALECDVVIGTALIDMYGKCGCVQRAVEVFEGMPSRDVLTWTAMISVFGLHGHVKEAFDLFEEMGKLGVKPNHVTFVGLLSACAHSGLLEKGRECFEMMKLVYLIEPQVYHYACMIDILSRAGQLEEAVALIGNMSVEPDVFCWGALLGGCQMHGNVDLGEKVAEYLISLKPSNHVFYAILCDLYAKAKRFGDVKRVRAFMKERGFKKESPGCSMIEVGGVVHEFSVKGSLYVVMEEVEWVLNQLSDEMKRMRLIYQNQKSLETEFS